MPALDSNSRLNIKLSLSVGWLDCRRIGTAVVSSGFVSQAYQRDSNQDYRHISMIVVSFIDRRRIGAIIWLVDRRHISTIVRSDLRPQRGSGCDARCSGTISCRFV